MDYAGFGSGLEGLELWDSVRVGGAGWGWDEKKGNEEKEGERVSGRHGSGFFGVTERMSLVSFCFRSLDFCCVAWWWWLDL